MHLGPGFDKQTKTLQLADGEGRISSVVFTSGVDLNANSSSVATITTIVEDSTDDKRGMPDIDCTATVVQLWTFDTFSLF